MKNKNTNMVLIVRYLILFRNFINHITNFKPWI